MSRLATYLILLASASCCLGATKLDSVLARMDQNSATFKSVSANVRQIQYTAVIKEEDVSEGTLHMKRSKRNIQFLAEFTLPDKKAVALSGTKAELYYPKNNTVDEYDLGKHRFEKYMALGFGASGSDLKEDYHLRELGVEAVAGDKSVRLELIPKSPDALQNFPKIELWISEATGYPVQQKLHQTGGDYYTITYSNVVINPSLPDSAYKLSLPKGVKRVFPGK